MLPRFSQVFDHMLTYLGVTHKISPEPINRNNLEIKEEAEGGKKVSDSIDTLFHEERSSRLSKKIFKIGEKRITSDVSSSESRERELVNKSRNPLILKNHELAHKNNTSRNELKFGKDIARLHTNKIPGSTKTMIKMVLLSSPHIIDTSEL